MTCEVESADSWQAARAEWSSSAFDSFLGKRYGFLRAAQDPVSIRSNIKRDRGCGATLVEATPPGTAAPDAAPRERRDSSGGRRKSPIRRRLRAIPANMMRMGRVTGAPRESCCAPRNSGGNRLRDLVLIGGAGNVGDIVAGRGDLDRDGRRRDVVHRTERSGERDVGQTCGPPSSAATEPATVRELESRNAVCAWSQGRKSRVEEFCCIHQRGEHVNAASTVGGMKCNVECGTGGVGGNRALVEGNGDIGIAQASPRRIPRFANSCCTRRASANTTSFSASQELMAAPISLPP